MIRLEDLPEELLLNIFRCISEDDMAIIKADNYSWKLPNLHAACIQDLPQELLLSIFQHVYHIDDQLPVHFYYPKYPNIVSCSRPCQVWRAIVMQEFAPALRMRRGWICCSA